MTDHDAALRGLLRAAREWLAGSGAREALDSAARMAEFVYPQSDVLQQLRIAALSCVASDVSPARLVRCIHQAEDALGLPLTGVAIRAPKPWRPHGVAPDAAVPQFWSMGASFTIKTGDDGD